MESEKASRYTNWVGGIIACVSMVLHKFGFDEAILVLVAALAPSSVRDTLVSSRRSYAILFHRRWRSLLDIVEEGLQSMPDGSGTCRLTPKSILASVFRS